MLAVPGKIKMIGAQFGATVSTSIGFFLKQ